MQVFGSSLDDSRSGEQDPQTQTKPNTYAPSAARGRVREDRYQTSPTIARTVPLLPELGIVRLSEVAQKLKPCEAATYETNMMKRMSAIKKATLQVLIRLRQQKANLLSLSFDLFKMKSKLSI